MAARIEALYSDALNDLQRRLERLNPFPVSPINFGSDDDVIKFTTALFAAGVYGDGRAILSLYRADVGRKIPSILRSQFEAVIKLNYCEFFPKKAHDYVDSEPFVRWTTARGKKLRKDLKDAIEGDALKVLRLRPDLLNGEKYKVEILAGKMPISDEAYKHVAKKLDFESMPKLMRQLDAKNPGWTTDLYATIYGIGSLGTHHSVGYLRDVFTMDEDGKVRFIVDPHYDGAADYLLQSSNYVFGIAGKITQRFGGDLEDPSDPLHEIYKRQQEIVTELRAGDLI